MTEIHKIGHAVDFTGNAFAVRCEVGLYDPEWARRQRLVSETPPSDEDWAEYRRAAELWDTLSRSPYFDCEEPELTEPTPTRVYEYTETEEEWLARIAQWRSEGREPRDLLGELMSHVVVSALGKSLASGERGVL